MLIVLEVCGCDGGPCEQECLLIRKPVFCRGGMLRLSGTEEQDIEDDDDDVDDDEEEDDDESDRELALSSKPSVSEDIASALRV